MPLSFGVIYYPEIDNKAHAIIYMLSPFTHSPKLRSYSMLDCLLGARKQWRQNRCDPSLISWWESSTYEYMKKSPKTWYDMSEWSLTPNLYPRRY